MKKLLMLSVAILALSAGAAYAEHEGGHEGKWAEKGAMMFDEADANDDGLLSKEEFLSRHEKKFVEIDANADGQISKEEMEARRQEWLEKRKAEKAAEGAEAPVEAPAVEVSPSEGAAE
jgi:hypothetical protein